MRNRPITELSEIEIAEVRAMVTYEDGAVIAFDKPSGLACQTRNPDDHTLDRLLWAFARSNGKRPYLVHRLDAATSGIMLAAKTKPARAALSKAFEARQVKKTYLALIGGHMPRRNLGQMMQSLHRVRTDDGMEITQVCPSISPDAKDARTDWRILDRKGDVALVRARPQTGRMHQIRVHFAHMGLPVLGDKIYGDAAPGPRLMLHAETLDVPNSEGGRLVLKAPLPEVFHEVMAEHGLKSIGSET